MKTKNKTTMEDWEKQFLERFTKVIVTQTINRPKFSYRKLISKKDNEQKIINFIKRLLKTNQVKQELMLDLLAFFDDYNHPIEMTAKYVRDQIVQFLEKVK